MAFIIGLYLVVDVLQHKGQARVLFPKDFPESKQPVLEPYSESILIFKDKNWRKGVNTKERMNEMETGESGFECDVYFDRASEIFDIHHDADKSTGFSLKNLLQLYEQKKMLAGIWLDIKNLDDSNATSILKSLIELRKTYRLENRVIVESDRADLLSAFSDSSFFTSYYIPFFNPYKINSTEINFWADSIVSVASKAKINALSGYYFQCSFLNHYFSQYPVLTWIDNSSFSLVNYLFKRKVVADKSIFILLKP